MLKSLFPSFNLSNLCSSSPDVAGLLFSSSLEDIGVMQGGSLHRRLGNKREKTEGSLEQSGVRCRRHSGDSSTPTPTGTVLGLSLNQGETDPHKIACNLGDDAKILSGTLRKSRRPETLDVNSKHTHDAPRHALAHTCAQGLHILQLNTHTHTIHFHMIMSQTLINPSNQYF